VHQRAADGGKRRSANPDARDATRWMRQRVAEDGTPIALRRLVREACAMSPSLRASLLSALTVLSAACATEDDPPPARLSAVEDLAPGTVCAAGGITILAGDDLDDDGVLDAAEIDSRTPRCAGAPPASLTRQDELVAGERCPAGGTAFHTGRDDDGDGVLDDAEIESTAVACTPDAIWDGDLEITAADVEAGTYVTLRVVTGDLRLSGVGPGALAALEAVGGNLAVTDGSALELPALVTVAGDLSAGSAPTLVAPRLERIGGQLSGAMVDLALPALERAAGIWLTDRILHIDLPALADVDGVIAVNERAALVRASLPGLISAGAITLHVGADASVDLASLFGADSLSIRAAASTRTELDLGTLYQVPGELVLHGLAITDLSSLATLRKAGVLRVSTLAGLTSVAGLRAELELGELDIVGNQALTSLVGLPALGTLTRLAINNNDVLTDLRGLDGVTHVTGNVFVGNNLVLSSLTGLAVRRIGGELRLLRNFELRDIAALDALTTLAGGLEVGFNPIPADALAALRARLGR
jgi:hypothetical protein